MSDFNKALELNGFGEILEKRYGQWGKFSSEAADLVLEVSGLESISPELLVFTWGEESCFNFRPEPNTNNQPQNVYSWDLGPMQLNMGWAYKSIWVKEYKADNLHYDQVFGKLFYTGDGKPANFTGDPKANLRMSSRRLLARRGDDEYRATQYPGPNSRPYRQRAWQQLGWMYREFFREYSK